MFKFLSKKKEETGSSKEKTMIAIITLKNGLIYRREIFKNIVPILTPINTIEHQWSKGGFFEIKPNMWIPTVDVQSVEIVQGIASDIVEES